MFRSRPTLVRSTNALGLLLAFIALPGLTCADKASARGNGDAFFNPPVIHEILVEIPAAALAKLRSENRTYVTCNVTVDGRFTLTNTGVHLKGHATFRGLDDRPSLTLNFSKFTDNQTLMGIRKLHLNNSLEDPTYLSEHLAGGLYAAADMPASRVTFARLNLNGRDLGLYTTIEGLSKEFLRRYFTDIHGNLYDGGFCQDLTEKKQKLLGENPENQSDLTELVQAAREPDLPRRWERLNALLDVDKFCSYLAMEVLTGNWDGYTFNLNNYRLFHHQASGKFVFIPHGMDDMFKQTRNPLRPEPMKGLVARGFLETPEGRERYLARVGSLFTNQFRLAPLLARVDALDAIVKAARPKADASTEFRQRITLHHQLLQKHFASAPPMVAAMPKGPAAALQLSGWAPEKDSGSPALDEPQYDGRPTLHISASDKPCVASWRTTVALPAGRHRFTGQARTASVDPQTGDPGTGAGLRISGGKRVNQLTATKDWTALEYDFEVKEATDVIFVAELRAKKGEVWFDPATLKLMRQ
ncbi:MAG: hypothetical protein EBS05_25485 [Proteobacteria bacterium]|nr:hypothetical protein [Pseudomonadota bacterium]